MAFFSGNSVCWQIRNEEGGRAFTCWKQNYFRIRSSRRASTPRCPPPESSFGPAPGDPVDGGGVPLGRISGKPWSVHGEPAEYTVHRPEHWVFDQTGLKRGDVFGGRIPWWDMKPMDANWNGGMDSPFATHRDGSPETFTVLGTCPVRWQEDDREWYERWEKGVLGRRAWVFIRGAVRCLPQRPRTGRTGLRGGTRWSSGSHAMSWTGCPGRNPGGAITQQWN